MNRFSLAGAALLLSTTSLLAQQAPPPAPPAPTTLTPAQLAIKATAQNVPEIPYKHGGDFIKLPPNLYLGESVGVARNSKSEIFIYTRNGEGARLLKFDKDGKFMREIGRGSYAFAMAHAVRVDAQDFIWTVDEGTNTIVKWSPEGRPVMIIGRRHEPIEGTISAGLPLPPATPYNFNRPTDIAWDAAGNIFVSDGYNNGRVVKYNKDGRFIKSYGTRGREAGQFNTVHGIQVDAAGNVYAADRNNGRIQVLDNDLNPKAMYTNVGRPWSLCITNGPHQYLYSSNSNPDTNNSETAAVSGEIYKMELDGRIVGKFGHAGKQLGEFATTHAIDCRNENELIIGEIISWRIQKIFLQPTASTTTSSR